MAGYIKLYRDLQFNRIWQEKPYTRGQAWIDMLLRCNHVCVQMPPQYQSIWVLRGQFLLSNIKLAEAWGWSEKSVRRFMEYLVNESMIRYFPLTKFTVYEITKYAELQALEPEYFQAANAEQMPNKRRAKAEQMPTNNNDNNDNNKKIIYTALQLEILDYWNSKNITRHQQTEEMQKAIQAALKKYGRDKIIQAIDNYVTVYSDDKYFYSATWRLDKFLKQSNGVKDFLEDGQQWVNYKNRKDKSPGKQQYKPVNTGNFDQREYPEEFYDNIYKNVRDSKKQGANS